MKTLKITPLISLAALLLFAGGCSKKGKDPFQMIRHVKVSTYQEHSVNYAQVEVTLDTAGVALPSLDAPIFNPNAPEEVFGRFWIRARTDGLTDVGASVDLNRSTKLPSQEPLLPNGRPIPLGGVEKMIVFQVDKKLKIRVYLALANNQAVVGTAIPIREFDKIGRKLGGVNFFPLFQFNDVQATAGVFTGAAEGQNGVAVFVDASKALSKVLPPPLQGSAAKLAQDFSQEARWEAPASTPFDGNLQDVSQDLDQLFGEKKAILTPQTRLKLYEVRPKASTMEKLKEELYQTLAKTPSLHVH